ncbi:unnamed protein product [Musa acuminata subsp. malaccensis]|uniref:non-specific serine/threonine protein kinase n=1 Tax=Musa acuminata subsp. malaccensis TaxID=214687 RepID=A0A804JGL3_MUSAM|nr:unnamed protein product [Musa acuminata subsp. malaccensis]
MGAETSISSTTSRHPRWSASDWLHIRRTGGCNRLARPLMSRALDEGDHDALVDPEVGDDHDYKEMGRMTAGAAACTPHSASLTPRMSQQVVRALEGGVSVDELSEGGATWSERAVRVHDGDEKAGEHFDEPRRRRRQRAELKHR